MSLRLPQRFRDRWVYGAFAALSAALVWSFFLSVSSGWLGGQPIGINSRYLLAAISAPTLYALFLFPRQSSGQSEMKACGAMIVLLSFITYSLAFGVSAAFNGAAPFLILQIGWRVVYAIVGFLLLMTFGTVFTFGLPWFLAIYLSALFSEDEQVIDIEAAEALNEFVQESFETASERAP